MKQKDIDSFFEELATRLQEPVTIYLTGGVAAWYYGGVRPTEDIDFGVHTKAPWDEIAAILHEVSREQKIAIEFAEDISRWGMIGLRAYTKGAKTYHKFGPVTVKLLTPIIWSVGKMNRYTADDLSDIRAVFKQQQPKLNDVLKTWARALKESPPSSEQGLFIKKVADFLRHEAPKIWAKLDADQALAQFNKYAGIKT